MMDAFNAVLEARDPEHGCFRAYRLEAGTDLFGTWLVEITFGPIGLSGQMALASGTQCRMRQQPGNWSTKTCAVGPPLPSGSEPAITCGNFATQVNGSDRRPSSDAENYHVKCELITESDLSPAPKTDMQIYRNTDLRLVAIAISTITDFVLGSTLDVD